MTKSGITRRIDELGRIVVPKEMRYNLGIRDGEPLEIYTDNNAIIIKKFSQVENIKDISENVCNLISDVCNVDIMISDREKIVACSNNLKHLLGVTLGETHKKLIDFRENWISEKKEVMFDLNKYFTIIPIITSLDSSGLVFILSDEYNDVNVKYAKIAQKLIVQKLDVAS